MSGLVRLASIMPDKSLDSGRLCGKDRPSGLDKGKETLIAKIQRADLLGLLHDLSMIRLVYHKIIVRLKPVAEGSEISFPEFPSFAAIRYAGGYHMHKTSTRPTNVSFNPLIRTPLEGSCS